MDHERTTEAGSHAGPLEALAEAARTATAAGDLEGGAVRSGPIAADAPARSIRDELAELVARALREGNATLARTLLEAHAAAVDASPAGVVDLAAVRAGRRS